MSNADPSDGEGEPRGNEDGEGEAGVETTRSGPYDRATVTADGLEDRLDALERTGAVDGYVPRVDYEGLGFRTALIRIDARHGDAAGVAEELRDGPGVAIYRTSGRFDIVAVCRFPDAAAFERTVARLAIDARVRAHRAAVVRRIVAEGDTLPLADDEDSPSR